uniref:Nucleolar complex protein 3 homolog n=1 Tax=Sinocyclocheilus rhinocerous TaxID=307959 RepID=A0A673N1Z9_9TELE
MHLSHKASKRNKKKKPSFRKLLKTSNLKLENKQKNRQFKQQSSAKKQRKEHRKLRQAITDVSHKTLKPLERYKKKPEEDEEEFLESLPVDMMDEDDLEQIRAMAKKASFLTRDISSCAPVHAKKRKSEQQVKKYEKMPRKMQQEEEKELIHLLPIKDKSGLIPQSMEKPGVCYHMTFSECWGGFGINWLISVPLLTPQEQLELRTERLTEKKLRIASLSSAVLADPHVNIKKLKELRAMLMETDPCVAITVRKLVMVSLLEVFKDIVPSYRIRPLTEEEKATKVKKETLQLREFEEGLVSQYKFFLEDLEQIVKDWKQKKQKRSQAVSLQSYKGLAEVAIRCICDLLVALPHFNFHNNIVVMVVPLLSDPVRKVSEMCCEAVRKLLKQDKLGQASLAVVKVISGMVKGRNYKVKPEVLNCLHCLRIKEVEMKKDTEDSAPKKKFMSFKEKRTNLSRMQRKWKKAEEKLQKELLEAEASESKDKKIKLHTETLNIVFLTYFRILKKAQKSILLPSVLEGLAKFAHLINLEFFDDLLAVLYGLITSGDLMYRESLHCILTSFHILSGQGDVLNIDPLKFYNHLYKTLLTLHAGEIFSSVSLFCTCSDTGLFNMSENISHLHTVPFGTGALHEFPVRSVTSKGRACKAALRVPN